MPTEPDAPSLILPLGTLVEREPRCLDQPQLEHKHLKPLGKAWHDPCAGGMAPSLRVRT
jgi:hypothetical protein